MEKIHKEVCLGRVRGPFVQPPIHNLQIFPVGLVEKSGSTTPINSEKHWRLIHHLSYGFGDPDLKGVNQYIPESKKMVQYSSFDDAINLVCEQGEGCWMAKSDSDMLSAEFLWILILCNVWGLKLMVIIILIVHFHLKVVRHVFCSKKSLQPLSGLFNIKQ